MKKITYLLLFLCATGFSQSPLVLASMQQSAGGSSELYTTENAIKLNGDSNSVTGTTVDANWPATSVSSSPTPYDGSYCMLFTHGGPDNTLYSSYILLSGLEIGETYTVGIWASRMVGGNYTLQLPSSYGWSTSPQVSINGAVTADSWIYYELEAVATSTAPRLLIQAASNADTGNKIAVDALSVIKQ